MTGILPASEPQRTGTKQMNRPRPPRTLSPTRRALLGAGVTTLALSLALSIAPAWAKSGNSAPSEGNGASGTVKLRDATTSDLVPETSNDPHVCAFSIVFEYNPATTGTWQILSWPPTGDGSQVSSGSWDTTVGGSDETDVMTEPAGHYRLEYQAVGASNSRNKSFWVADGCDESGGSTGGEQGDTGSGEQPGDSGDQGDQGQDEQGETGDQGDQGQDEQGETGDQGDQGQDEQGETGDQGDQGQDEQGETGDQGDQGQDEQGETGDQGDQGQDEQGDTGSGEQPGDSGDQGDQTEEGDVQGATGGDQNGSGGSQPGDQSGSGGPESTNDQPSVQPGHDDGGTQGVSSPSGGEGPTLPNTATTPASVLSPLLAALGLLLVIAAHPFIRRSALADRA
jgi:hypothetical protein